MKHIFHTNLASHVQKTNVVSLSFRSCSMIVSSLLLRGDRKLFRAWPSCIATVEVLQHVIEGLQVLIHLGHNGIWLLGHLWRCLHGRMRLAQPMCSIGWIPGRQEALWGGPFLSWKNIIFELKRPFENGLFWTALKICFFNGFWTLWFQCLWESQIITKRDC